MASQTEFERGALWGINEAKKTAAIRILDLNIPIPKQEKEA